MSRSSFKFQLSRASVPRLRLQPYKQQTIAQRKSWKLSPRFYGTFQVLEKVGNVAYRLDLPPESRIHSVFHVSCLKEKLGQKHRLVVTLPLTDLEGVVRPKPEEILDRRMMKKKGRVVTEILVKWKGLGAEKTSWREYAEMAMEYPDLVGKVF